MACASCGADNGHFYDCPESRFARIETTTASIVSPIEEPANEKSRLVAIPIALVVMWLLVHTSLGGFITRLCFAMPLHELGHAVSSWFTGAYAVPLLWFTPMGEERMPSLVVAELIALGLWIFYARKNEWALWPPVTVAVLLGIGLLIPSHARQAFVTFAGDGGGLLFGTALMGCVFLPEDLRITRGGLRWGYLVIGAGAFTNIASEWFSAWRDNANIGFGHIEGVGLSDPSKLVDVFGWSERRLINSYLTLSVVCLVALTVLIIFKARQRE